MELRQLRYFVAVAEALHFSRAAEQMHVAQPSVSQQIRRLEEELGVRLFERNQRTVALTAGGGALLEEARRLLRQADVAKAAARSAERDAGWRLRIGYLPDLLPKSVSHALQRLAVSNPALQVRVETGLPHRIIEDVQSGRLEAAVVCLPAPAGELWATLLGGQRAVAALPTLHPHAAGPAVDLRRLAPERLVSLPRQANPAFFDAVLSGCREAGLAPDVSEVGELRVEHVLLSVASGAGIALVPECVAQRHTAPGVRFLPLEGIEPASPAAVLTRPDAVDPATLAFLRALPHARGLRPVRDEPAPAVAAA